MGKLYFSSLKSNRDIGRDRKENGEKAGGNVPGKEVEMGRICVIHIEKHDIFY